MPGCEVCSARAASVRLSSIPASRERTTMATKPMQKATPLGNWQTWHNAGMIAGGAVIGDAAWVEKASKSAPAGSDVAVNALKSTFNTMVLFTADAAGICSAQ